MNSHHNGFINAGSAATVVGQALAVTWIIHCIYLMFLCQVFCLKQKAKRVTFIRVSAKWCPPHRIFHPATCLAQVRFTFLLSHAFVLPGTAKQHQPHPLSDQELYARASRLGCTDDRSASTALRSWGLVATPQPNIRQRSSPLRGNLCMGRFIRKEWANGALLVARGPMGWPTSDHTRNNGALLLVRGGGPISIFCISTLKWSPWMRGWFSECMIST